MLLEGDLRRPSLGKQFGLGSLPGLSEWLKGEPRPIQDIYRLEGLNLWFLPAGRPPENPLELMQSGRLSQLLNQLSAWFDWIVIDSPPILPLADTSVWARLADGILLVTREGTTKRRMLQRGLQALEQSKLLGAVVNSSANTDHSNYYQRYGPGQRGKPMLSKNNQSPVRSPIPSVSLFQFPVLYSPKASTKQLQSRSFVPAPKKEAGRGEGVVNVRRSGGIASLDTLSAEVVPVEERGILNEGAFHRMISLERKRTERSRKPFLLMLLDMGNGLRSDNNKKALDKILSALSLSTRETDVTGWYQEQLRCRSHVHGIWG